MRLMMLQMVGGRPRKSAQQCARQRDNFVQQCGSFEEVEEYLQILVGINPGHASPLC